MGNDAASTGDPIWDQAWAWVVRQHDRANFDAAARDALEAWLRADPAHGRAYEKAGRLWLLAGLVPPANDVGPHDAPDFTND